MPPFRSPVPCCFPYQIRFNSTVLPRVQLLEANTFRCERWRIEEMEQVKPTLQWAETTLRALSDQGYTGTVIIRFAQGGVQGIAVNQELQPRQHVMPVRL